MNTLVNTHLPNKRLTIVLIILGGLLLHPKIRSTSMDFTAMPRHCSAKNKNLLMARNTIEIGQQKKQEAKANLHSKAKYQCRLQVLR
jgi:hypothetical protein